jgi:hypothetical protein
MGKHTSLQGLINTKNKSLPNFCAFACSWIWQNTDCAVLELSILHLLHYLAPLPLPLSTPLLALLTSLARDRLIQVLDKLYLTLALTATSIDDRASRSVQYAAHAQRTLFFFAGFLKLIFRGFFFIQLALFQEHFSFSRAF